MEGSVSNNDECKKGTSSMPMKKADDGVGLTDPLRARKLALPTGSSPTNDDDTSEEALVHATQNLQPPSSADRHEVGTDDEGEAGNTVDDLPKNRRSRHFKGAETKEGDRFVTATADYEAIWGMDDSIPFIQKQMERKKAGKRTTRLRETPIE